MFQDNSQGAGASNIPPADGTLPQYEYEIVHHTLLGPLNAVQDTIKHLYALNYAEPDAWSRPLPTGRVNEVMAIITRRVRIQ